MTPRATNNPASAPGAAAGTEEQDIAALQHALQEQRRALTLLRAEADKERELREALEAQLLEANAEIVASWDRRKEMARVIGERDALLAEAREENKAHKERRREMSQIIHSLKEQLDARYAELAALQRHMLLYTPKGWTRMIVRRARKLGGKAS